MNAIFSIKGMVLATTKESITLLLGAREHNINSRGHISQKDMIKCKWIQGIQSNICPKTGDEVIAQGQLLQENDRIELNLISLR